MVLTRPYKEKKIVASLDTDVFVVLAQHFSHMDVREIFFKTGKKSTHADLTSFIPVHKVVWKLNEDQKNILLSVYAVTGCDTCCALFACTKRSTRNPGELKRMES